MTNITHPALRFLTSVIDLLLVILLIVILPIMLLAYADSYTGIFNSLGWILIITMFGGTILSLLQIYLVSSFGGTLGKLICGVKIVDAQGNHLTFGKALFREFVGSFVAAAPTWAGFIWILVDKKTRRGWNDLVADTYVVNHSTTTNALVGLIALVVLVVASVWSISQSVSSFITNKSYYQTIFGELSESTTEDLKESRLAYKCLTKSCLVISVDDSTTDGFPINKIIPLSSNIDTYNFMVDNKSYPLEIVSANSTTIFIRSDFLLGTSAGECGTNVEVSVDEKTVTSFCGIPGQTIDLTYIVSDPD